MADFQAKICEKFNIKSLTDNQSKFITAIIDGKDVFVGTKTGSVKCVLIGCSYPYIVAALHINRHRVTAKIRLTMPRVKMSRADRNPWLAKMRKTVVVS